MNERVSNLLVNSKTRTQIEYFIVNPPHAILISGPSGSGKKTLSLKLAADLLETTNLETHPYFHHLNRLKNKQDISIEQVREVTAALKLKVPGQNKTQRVVFIENAHNLNIPAQNALLKVLEEPAAGTVFLLSVNSSQNVLPTIKSRMQRLDVLPISLKNAQEFWSGDHSDEEIQSAWRLSGGYVGLMSALLQNNQDHPLKEAVLQARKFLSAKKYERLLIIDGLSRNKEQFDLFLEALGRILSFLHHSAVKSERSKQAQSILKARQELQTTQQALRANASPKLSGLNLTLSLKV